MKRSVISVKNLSKVYKLYSTPMDRFREALNPWKKKYHKEFFALNDLSLDIYEGEVVGVLGANGAGKSTLLKILAGVLTPTSGQIKINGKVSALLELGMGFNPELNGEENIIFNATVLGLSPEKIKSKLVEIIEFADIGEYIKQPLKSYSSGMVARLAFAIAVNLDAEILVIDEALSVGDVRFQQKAIRKMTALMSKAKAILFVSHSLDSIKRFCTRAIWINGGKVVEDGETTEVLKHYYAFMTGANSAQQVAPGLKEFRKFNFRNAPFLEKLEWHNTEHLESIGDNGARVKRIALYDKTHDRNVEFLEGGEDLELILDIAIFEHIGNPSVTCFLNNHLGLNIFGVSSSSFDFQLDSLSPGSNLLIKVGFQLPYLLNGLYSLTVNISDLPHPEVKVKKHQVYDAFILQIQSSDPKQKQGSILIPQKATFQII